MATPATDLHVTIPAATAADVVDAFCAAYGYSPLVYGGAPDPMPNDYEATYVPNPQSREEFTLERIKLVITSVTNGWLAARHADEHAATLPVAPTVTL
jgi:hypothetical protein